MIVLSKFIVLVVFLVICYLIAAPLFLNRYHRLDLLQVIVSCALGSMIAALVFVLGLVLGITNHIVVLSVLFGVATYNVSRLRLRIIPKLNDFSRINGLLYWITIVPFCGAVLVAQFKMGYGEFPHTFFGLDTPLKLADAHQLTISGEYPPRSLMIEGWMPAYHYGAQSIVALIARVSRLPVHLIMFSVVAPLLILACHSVCLQILQKSFGSSRKALIGFVLFLPLFLLGPYLWDIVTSDVTIRKYFSLFFGSHTVTTYDSAAFGSGIWDVSVLAGIFLLLLASEVNQISDPKRVFGFALVIAPVAVLMKLDTTPAIYCLLATAVVFLRAKLSIKLIVSVLLGIVSLGVLTLFIFGYFDNESHAGMIQVRPLEEIHSRFDWRWNAGRADLAHFYLLLILVALGMFCFLCCEKGSSKFEVILRLVGWGAFLGAMCSVVFIGLYPHVAQKYGFALFVGIPMLVLVFSGVLRFLYLSNLGQAEIPLRLLIAGFGVAITSITIIAVVEIPGVGSQFFLASWICLPLIGVALLGNISKNLRLTRIVVLCPILAVAVLAQWGKVEHLVIALKMPEKIEEFTGSNELLARALISIPIRGTIVVTNDFRFGGWPDTNRAIPALFGHQAYGVDLRHLPSKAGYNVEGGNRIDLQRVRLSRNFSVFNEDHSRETKLIATKRGWTHYLMRKDLDDNLPSIDSKTIPLDKVYENERYAVFEF